MSFFPFSFQLGFPIIDDKLYNDFVWGPTKGKLADYGKPLSQVNNQGEYDGMGV